MVTLFGERAHIAKSKETILEITHLEAGNAVQEMKDVADYVSLTNNNKEGVRHVIEKFVLEPQRVSVE